MENRKLTKMQKAFADNYIKTGNGTQSALDAGYSKNSAHVQANENLKKPNIKKYIDKRLTKIDKKEIIDQQEVLKLLSEIATGQKKERVTVYDKEIHKHQEDDKFIENHKNIPKEVDEVVHTREQIKALELFTKIYSLTEESSTVTNVTINNDTKE